MVETHVTEAMLGTMVLANLCSPSGHWGSDGGHRL